MSSDVVTPERGTAASPDEEIAEIEAELRECEAEIEDRSAAMGQLRSEFAFNQRKLREGFYPRALPLLTSVHMNMYYRARLEREIAWLEKKVIAMEQYKAGYFELRDLALPKKTLFDDLQPSFEEALLTMTNVTKQELSVLRSYENPPPVVLATILTIMVLREEEPVWEESKVLLSETYYYSFFINKCRHRTKAEPPTAAQLDALEKYCLDPENTHENVARASIPAGAMSLFLHTLDTYYHLDRITTPTKDNLDEVKAKLMKLRTTLEEKKEDVADAQAKLEALNQELWAQVVDLRDRYDGTMEPLQDLFFDANRKFNDAFCSPKRRQHEGSSLSP